MAEFESWKAYTEFSWFVMRKSRHILDTEHQKFLDSVVETSYKRKAVIKMGKVLWRAQLNALGEETPLPAKRMSPLVDRANEGRVNPKGIPCLYCATDKRTAMTETRPWMGSLVSVAQFVVRRDLTVVDCSKEKKWLIPLFSVPAGKEPKPGEREKAVWAHINWAFSEPVTRNDNVAEYAPTQVLAEAFRNDGYDGIVYRSKLGTGLNVAIFDLTAAKCADCYLYRVENVTPKFTRIATP